MTYSLPVDYSSARALDEEAAAIQRRLAAALPRDLVAMVEAEIPKDSAGNTPREWFTDWEADMLTAYMMTEESYAVFRYEDSELTREQFSDDVNDAMRQAVLDHDEVRAAVAAYRENKAALDEVNGAISLITTFAEDVYKGRLQGNPYGGAGEIVFESEEVANACISRIDHEAEDEHRNHLVMMGIGVSVPFPPDSPTA